MSSFYRTTAATWPKYCAAFLGSTVTARRVKRPCSCRCDDVEGADPDVANMIVRGPCVAENKKHDYLLPQCTLSSFDIDAKNSPLFSDLIAQPESLKCSRLKRLNNMSDGTKLVGVIGDEDTVTGFILAGVGHRTAEGTNFLVVKPSTSWRCATASLGAFSSSSSSSSSSR